LDLYGVIADKGYKKITTTAIMIIMIIIIPEKMFVTYIIKHQPIN